MLFFMGIQVFGMIKTSLNNRTYHWLDSLYLIGVLTVCVGLNYFDYLLLQDYQHLRRKVNGN